MKNIILPIAALPFLLTACNSEPPEAPPVEEKLAEYKAIGTEPFWSIEIKDDQIAYSSPEATNDFTLPIQRMKKTPTGWEIKGFNDQHNITVTVASAQKCNDGMSDNEYADTVKVAVSNAGYQTGCGGDILSGPATEASVSEGSAGEDNASDGA